MKLRLRVKRKWLYYNSKNTVKLLNNNTIQYNGEFALKN